MAQDYHQYQRLLDLLKKCSSSNLKTDCLLIFYHFLICSKQRVSGKNERQINAIGLLLSGIKKNKVLPAEQCI